MYLVEKQYFASMRDYGNPEDAIDGIRRAIAEHTGITYHDEDFDHMVDQYELEGKALFYTVRTDTSNNIHQVNSMYLFDSEKSYRVWCRILGFKANEDEESVDFAKYKVKARIKREPVLDWKNNDD